MILFGAIKLLVSYSLSKLLVKLLVSIGSWIRHCKLGNPKYLRVLARQIVLSKMLDNEVT